MKKIDGVATACNKSCIISSIIHDKIMAHIKINICRKCVGSTHHYLYEQVQKFHPIPPPKPKQKTKKEGREQTRKIIMVYSYLLAVFLYQKQ